jgi:NAD(P)-dependent dehydrogenase (short-subunit alcohol dehydrogenase family)
MTREPTPNLEGRVVIVTGALGLLGRNHCRALARAGANVVVADLDHHASVDFAGSLSAGPDRLASLGQGLDVTDRGSLERLRDQVLARFGRIDVLVNNAAINDMFESPIAALEQSSFESYPLELFRRALDVNVTGMFLACQILGAPMAMARKGSIINVASTYGMVGPDQRIYVRPDGSRAFFKSPAYPSTKGAVLSFTRYLAAYWGQRNVRVNTLTPGGVQNGQEPWFVEQYAERTMLGRMARADEMSGALVFLASDQSDYMTGGNLVVDGGWTAW